MAEPVSYAVDGGVAIATIDNPPVNPLSAAVRQGLRDAVGRMLADPAAKGLVIAATGRAWVAGADITEFGKPRQGPSIAGIAAMIEAGAKPVVAAIQGVALGGGLELAMGCHARLLGPKAKLGLPEVKLGLLPGAGGVQRASRLMGAVPALRLIVGGDPLDATAAIAAGLAEALVEGDLLAAAKARVLQLAAAPLPAPASAGRPTDRAAFDAEAAALSKRAAAEPQIAAILDSLRNTYDLPFAEAVERDQAAANRLIADPRSQALRHVFFAEREAARIPGLPAGTTPRKVTRAAVIGAGTMGGGIAMCFANAGIPVTLIETGQDALDRGMQRLTGNYDTSVKRGSLTAEARAARLALIDPRVGLEAAAGADLVIEAVFEEMGLKKEIFGKLDIIAPGAVLASNTSYLDIDQMGAATSRPQDVLGMHFFSPANVMKLLEVVRGAKTSPEALATAMALGRQLAKVPVVSGVCHGFIGNRMLSRRTEQASALLLEGALPEQVDKALTDFGFRMGPFAMADLAGLDVGWRVRKATGAVSPIADALCEDGRFGQKTGKGYFLYPEGARAGVPDPAVTALIERVSAERGITRRAIAPQEIVERLIYPMINEGARILEEGIAFRPGDIDTVWINGYNWPAWRGGPMHYADAIGLPVIAARLTDFARGNDSLRPAPLLAKLAAAGKGFAST